MNCRRRRSARVRVQGKPRPNFTTPNTDAPRLRGLHPRHPIGWGATSGGVNLAAPDSGCWCCRQGGEILLAGACPTTCTTLVHVHVHVHVRCMVKENHIWKLIC